MNDYYEFCDAHDVDIKEWCKYWSPNYFSITKSNVSWLHRPLFHQPLSQGLVRVLPLMGVVVMGTLLWCPFSPLSRLRGSEVFSFSPFGVLGSFMVEPSSTIATNLARFLALWAFLVTTLFSLTIAISVTTPLWGSCEVATHTPENGTWESFGTPENLEHDCRGQNTSHWGVLGTVEKVLKCRCPKWPCMSHLDICSTSYGRKKGRESNWQFDSWPLKVGNRPDSGVCRQSATHLGKLLKRTTTLVQISSRSEFGARSYERPKSRESKPGQFRDSTLGVPGKRIIWMQVPRRAAGEP